MVTDPYAVLGISKGASEDEIKKAYRQKAKECHPDLHPEDPDATRKMNDVNEAYDMLMHPEKYSGRAQSGQQAYRQDYGQQSYERQGPYYGGSSSSGNDPFGQSDPYGQRGQYGPFQGGPGWFGFDDLFGFGSSQSTYAEAPREETMDSPEVRQAVQMINTQRYQDAMSVLSGIRSTGRDARWHYLFALAHYGLGNTITALEEIQKAVQLEPGNVLYQRTLQVFRRAGQRYDERSRGFTRTAMDPSRICMTFCLANLLCRFCFCRC